MLVGPGLAKNWRPRGLVAVVLMDGSLSKRAHPWRNRPVCKGPSFGGCHTTLLTVHTGRNAAGQGGLFALPPTLPDVEGQQISSIPRKREPSAACPHLVSVAFSHHTLKGSRPPLLKSPVLPDCNCDHPGGDEEPDNDEAQRAQIQACHPLPH